MGAANNGENDAWAAKFNPDGEVLWTKNIGSTANDYGFAIAAGLKAVNVGHEQLNPETARKTALLWDQWSANPDDLEEKKELNQSHTWFDLQKGIDCSLDAAADAKLIVCSPQQAIFAAIAAEQLSIPLVQVMVTPALLYQPNNWWRISQWMRQTQNKTYDRYHLHLLRFKQGLTDPQAWKAYWKYDRLIFVASPYLYPSPNSFNPS